MHPSLRFLRSLLCLLSLIPQVFFYRLLPPLLDPGFFLGANVDADVVGAAERPPAGAAGDEPNKPPEGAGAAGVGAATKMTE